MIVVLERRDALVVSGTRAAAMPCRQILRDDWGMFLAAMWLQDGRGRPLFLTLGHAWTTTARLRVLRLNFRLFPTHVDALRSGLEVLARGVPCPGSTLSAYQLVRSDLQPRPGYGRRAVLLERVRVRAEERRLVDVGAGDILHCDLELAEDLDLSIRDITAPCRPRPEDAGGYAAGQPWDAAADAPGRRVRGMDAPLGAERQGTPRRSY